MLCAHEPTVDPRIAWEAGGAAKLFDVTVLGFADAVRPLPEIETSGGYEIRRVPRVRAGVPTGVFVYLWHLVLSLRPAGRLVLLAACLILSPILLPLALLLALALGAFLAVRNAGQWPRWALSLRRLASSALRKSGLGSFYMPVGTDFASATKAFWPYVRALPRKPDVIHCNDLETLLVGVLARKDFGCKLVYDAHEYYPKANPEDTWIDKTLFHLIERYLIRRADSVVTVNHVMAEVMRRAYSLERVHAVPNAEPAASIGAKPRPSEIGELANGRVRFLFQGRFTPGRGIEEIIAAWPRVDGSQAALFIRGPRNRLTPELEALAARGGVLGKSVYFVEPVSERDLIAAAAEADVGIIPYKGDVEGYRYACPNKLSQYFHAGVMVLSNDLPYVRHVIEAADAGLLYSVGDPDSLIRAVSSIVSDRVLLKKRRANAQRYARERFNWEVFSPNLYSLYNEATN